MGLTTLPRPLAHTQIVDKETLWQSDELLNQLQRS